MVEPISDHTIQTLAGIQIRRRRNFKPTTRTTNRRPPESRRRTPPTRVDQMLMTGATSNWRTKQRGVWEFEADD